jgi:hypothetical protein
MPVIARTAASPRRNGSFPALLAVLLLPCLVAPAAAQKAAPLFSSNDVLDLTLAVPLRTLIVRKARRPELDAVLSYAAADGKTVTLDAEVTTRGHSRLQQCDFPPLKLNLKRKQVPDTWFAEQNKLKLVTRCKDSERYEQYLQLEYLIYRLYEQVTPLGFRVRPVSMHYVDTGRKNRTESAPGFLIEDVRGVADRAGMEVIERPSIALAELDPEQVTVMSVFQYVIGNTDWSTLQPDPDDDCCHNVSMIGRSDGAGGLVSVPYDFDQAGLIDAIYALPDERLGIRSVRERLYRGFCSGNDRLGEVVARFNAARARIEALFATPALLEDYRSRATEYLARSYEILNDPDQRQSEIAGRCRG